MLSAAVTALLSGPALATDTNEIKTVVSTAQKTSTSNTAGTGPGDILIDAGGGISFKSATVPMLTIDSSNNVNNGGSISASDQATATAVQIDANGLAGSFTNTGSISLGGSGTAKTGIYLAGTSSFTGNIDLESSSAVTIVGDQSVALKSDATAILNGDWLLAGAVTVQPSSDNESSSSQVVLANLQGITNGNILIGTSSTMTAIGNGAVGFLLGGALQHCTVASCAEIGTFANSGTIAVAGVATRSSNKGNANSGSAVIVQNGLAGGFVNNGPLSASDGTVAATIQGNGSTQATATILFTPGATLSAPMVIGAVTGDANGTYGFINRGIISASPEDPNEQAHAIFIAGSSTSSVNFTGGIFSSGTITASTTSIDPGTAVSATAIEIAGYANVPAIEISAQAGSGGTVLAQISGPMGGTAQAIYIHDSGTGSVSVPTITIDAGATVAANAIATDPSLPTVALSAVAIEDDTGTLTTLTNHGTISAFATTLTNGQTAHATAVFASGPIGNGLTFNNTGTVKGDVIFGDGSDTYNVVGTDSSTTGTATHTGAIDFGASSRGTNTFTNTADLDVLHVGQFANVAGSITSEGTLDIRIDNYGALSVQNVDTALNVRDLTLAGGGVTTAGTLNLTVSQGLGTTAVIAASDAVTFGTGAKLTVQYGSFIPLTGNGKFVLLSAPTGHLNIDQTDVDAYSDEVGGPDHLPYLFDSAAIDIEHVAGKDELVLNVVPKTVQALGITGYAEHMFPIANQAVAKDTLLGAALIAGINSQSDAQKAYDAFAPDVSGGVRQIAISLTDQGTGVVAARNRELRIFGKEQGDLTLWGNEFGEYFSTKGGNVSPSDPTLNSGAAPGFKDHGFGFSLGLDEGSASGGWYGAAFTFYTGDVSEGGDRISKTSTLWYMLTGYTEWRGRGLFIESQASLGYGNFKGKRILDLTIPSTAGGTTFTREADSKRAGLLASIGLTMGAQMHAGGLTMIPQLSLDGMTMREEGFTESGGGTGFDLAVKPYYANSLRAFLGSEFRTDIDLGDFFLQPAGRLGYRFDFLNDPVKLHAQFADTDPTQTGNQPGTPFAIQGPDPARGNYVAGAALNATTENWTIGLNYDFVRGSNNATEQVGTLSLLGRI